MSDYELTPRQRYGNIYFAGQWEAETLGEVLIQLREMRMTANEFVELWSNDSRHYDTFDDNWLRQDIKMLTKRGIDIDGFTAYIIADMTDAQ